MFAESRKRKFKKVPEPRVVEDNEKDYTDMLTQYALNLTVCFKIPR